MKRLLMASLLALLLLPLWSARANRSAPPAPQPGGPPPLPAHFSGTIRIAGANVPPGSFVSAWVNGHRSAHKAVEFDEAAGSVYGLNVNGDDPLTLEVDGGTDGAEITFVLELVDGGAFHLTPRAVWYSGAANSLPLGADAVTVLPLIFK